MKKALINTLWIIVAIVLFIVIVGGGYVLYIICSYYRIGDMELDISHSNSDYEEVSTSTTYSISTYNIGFGAYSQDYTFFLDTGYDDDGNETCGHYGKAKSKDAVLFNTNGAITTIANLNPDFALFQEVDVKATRSYKVNQYELITDSFSTYDSVFCLNFHSAFLPYPLYDMHGAVQAGLTTLSRYKIQSAERKEYTISDSLSKFFDLDRCFEVNLITVSNGKNLYIVNSHMSAYDEGGTIRAQQMQELNDFLQSCQDNGDYVIIGGDFNHDLITYNPDFSYSKDNRAYGMTKKTPDWVSFFFNEDGTTALIDGYTVVAADNHASCRNNDIEWDPNETFICTVDGFIISSNITVSSITCVETKNGNKGLDGFAYSDHEPEYMEFSLSA